VIGEGSRFTLKLPAEAQPKAVDLNSQSPEAQAHGEAARAGENPPENPPETASENDAQNDASQDVRVA